MKQSRNRPREILIFNDTRVDRHHGSDQVVKSIFRQLQKRMDCTISTVPAHHDWREDSAVLEQFKRADLVLVNGEGTIHHQRPAGKWLLQVGETAKALAVPCALVNCMWEDNSDEMRGMLKYFDLVSVRDRASYALLAPGVDKLRYVPDLSFDTDYESVAGLARNGIGISDSVLDESRCQLAELAEIVSAEVIAINYPAAGLKGQYRYLRCIIAAADIRHPRRVIRKLWFRLKALRNIEPDMDTFLKSLATYSLVVSGRFHVCTLCLVVGTPFVAGSTNSSKISRLIDDVGLATWRKTIPQILPDGSSMAWDPQELAAIAAHQKLAKSSINELFDDVMQLV